MGWACGGACHVVMPLGGGGDGAAGGMVVGSSDMTVHLMCCDLGWALVVPTILPMRAVAPVGAGAGSAGAGVASVGEHSARGSACHWLPSQWLHEPAHPREEKL